MNRLEDLIGKSVNEIDSGIGTDLERIGIKVAILEYKYKNCGRRYPKTHFKLTEIDYNDIIEFDELIDFDRICIIWHLNDIITDLEFFDISQDLTLIRKDYDHIRDMIEKGNAHNLRAGDTKYLAAYRLNEEVMIDDKKTNRRIFVLKKTYLQQMLNELNSIN